MEITTAPRPAPATLWGRTLLCAAVLVPLIGLVLLPLGLGLDRSVMTGASTDGAATGLRIPRGALLLERVVPVSDLRPGDVVTYEAPSAVGSGAATQHVVAIGDAGLGAGEEATSDAALLLPSDAVALARVEVVVPGVGWLHLALSSGVAWLVVGVSLLALGLLSPRGRQALTAFRARRETLKPAH